MSVERSETNISCKMKKRNCCKGNQIRTIELHAPPDVHAVCQFLDRHGSKDAKWNMAVRSCRHPHDSYESTIFDILKSFK